MRGMTNAATPAENIDPIRIFRKGTFTSVEGEKLTFGETELADIVASYNAAKDPAPLVVGHPKLDHPAYGWVDRMDVQGDEIFAYPDPELTDASFAELVNAGRYRKISAQLYPPDSPNNPAPGRYYLKHIGFLGAHPPSVKGLGTVSLADGDAGPLVTIEQENMMSDIDDKDRAASFAEREKTLGDREAAVATREKALADKAAADRHTANVSFAEGIFAEAKIKPEGKDLLVGVLDALGSEDTVSFGEGVELTPRAALIKIFDKAQPLVSLGEVAADDGKPIGEEKPADIAREAQSFAEAETKAGRPTSAAAAVRHVTNQKKKGA